MVVVTSSRVARVLIGVLIAILLGTVAVPEALAQTPPFALEVVAAADGAVDSTVSRKPTGWFDIFGAVRIADGLDVVARPLVTRGSFRGDWQLQMYELGLRYEKGGERRGIRLNVGQQPAPIGLALLENRPDLNPLVSINSAYYLPLPSFEPGAPRAYLISAAYPLGATATLSGPRWDARAAVVDSSPARGRELVGDRHRPRLANVIFGGGFTPRVGLRIGGAFAQGGYAAASELSDPSHGDRDATMVQVEAEWAFGYTKISGEFVHTTFETALDDAEAQGGWVQAVQTLAPRWFLAGRFDHQRTRWTRVGDHSRATDAYTRVESVLGYRLTPSVTLRGGYLVRKGYVVFHWDDQLVGSVVFSRRVH